MATATSTDTAAANGSVEQQLREVTRAILEFEARKLPELKARLEAVKKKKETSVPEYTKQFPALRDRWCRQNDDINAIRDRLIKDFKDAGGWKSIIGDCVCKYLARQRRRENLIACRSDVKGKLELARDQAQAAEKAAGEASAAWEDAAKTISSRLDANEALIKSITATFGKPEEPTALYTFWFKLLPAHASIRPDTDCFTIPADEMPDKLCPPPPPFKDCRDCSPYLEPTTNGAGTNGSGGATCNGGSGGTPAQSGGTPAQSAGTASSGTTSQTGSTSGSGGTSGSTSSGTNTPANSAWPRGEPWLIDPKDYPGQIDRAFAAWSQAKSAYAAAQAAFASNPDDLKAVIDERDAWAKSLEADIAACLKGHPAKGCCDKPTTTPPAPCTTPPAPCTDNGTQTKPANGATSQSGTAGGSPPAGAESTSPSTAQGA